MARPRSFDDDAIREILLHRFRAGGFGGTALPDLEAATGLSRKSLYNAFGDKEAMFVRALEDFRATTVRAILAPLRAEDAGYDAIALTLRELARIAATPQGRPGCLICNTAREPIAETPRVRRQVDAYFNVVETAIRRAIERGQARGEIRIRPPDDLARLCLGAVVSISVLARAGQPAETLTAIAEETVAALH